MANTSNLSSFLTDVADAIREKKGTQDQIPAGNFDTEIKSIETGTKINNQDKDITKNGTYTADEGYTGLGTVIVNVSQTGDVPVKLFKTKEEMNSSTGNTEGDLAVVYRSEVKNATVDSKFQVATFPETVVLDTAITDYVEVRYRAVDSSIMFKCMGQLDSSSFRMDCYTDSGNIRIEYTSSDGITYTRTDTTGNPVDFGTKIYYAYTEMWNDAIGKFIQIGGNHFEGIYMYKNNSWKLASTQLAATSDYVYKQLFYGKNGVESGTLGTADNSFADTNAELYNKIQNQYENMEPRILTDDNKTIDKNIYVIPVKKDGTPLLDTSQVTNMAYMFQSCSNLTTIPKLNTSKVTNMAGIFQGCSKLTAISELNTSQVTDMKTMFYECSNLTAIPELNTSNVTNMEYMFYGCLKLIAIPLLDTSNATDMHNMFKSCSNLTTIPKLNTSKVTNMAGMFQGCSKLITIPLLDTSSITTGNIVSTNMLDMFDNCINLSEDSLNIILQMCTNATSYTDGNGKTLRNIGLTSEQANKCKTLSNYSAFTSAGWTTGY